MPIPLPSLPEDNTTICLVIPNSPEWRQIYMGALQILAQWWYWEVENPEDSYDVIQRVMECAYLTGNNYEGCMELDCQDIIDCLNDPESDVLQTILDAVNSQNSNQLTSYSYHNKDLILGEGGNPTCDKDVLWGGIVNLVESANQNNIDALEILEVSTNQYEFLADVLTDILGVEVPVADAMLDWVVWLQQSILENYNAQITQEYLETIQCGLFCIAQETCELSPNDIYGYFANRVGSTFTFDSAIADVLTYLVTGSWSGTEIADVMFMSQFAFRALVGQWFNFVAFNSVDLDFRLGMNNPDNDWELLCNCDDEWEHEFDFTTGQHGWLPLTTPSRGSYVADTGFVSVHFSTNETGNYFYVDGLDSTTITRVYAHGTFTGDDTVSFRTARLITKDGSNPDVNTDYTPPNSPTILDWDNLELDTNKIGVYLYMTGFSPSPAPIWTCEGLTVFGTGDNPFI